MALGLPGLRLGHWTDLDALTGCTVVLPPSGNLTAVSVRGGGASTRELALLDPAASRHGEVAAIVLSGGSAFGLAAADGVVAWCAERGIGYAGTGHVIPIVPAAVVFDLGIGDPSVRPGPAAGRAACDAATTDDGPMGNVGAGTGATVGKTGGPELACKGGLGHAVVRAGDLVVGALAVVNAGGDVLDTDGTVLAGTRLPGGPDAAVRAWVQGASPQPPPGQSTTLGLVVTNAAITKQDVYRVAVQAHDGLARAVRPAHTTRDGDTVFALAAPDTPALSGPAAALSVPVDAVAFLAEEALARAIRAAVRAAAAAGGLPAGTPG